MTDDTGRVFGHEGLICAGSSSIATSLGVNPSLTVAAVTERCADARAGDPEALRQSRE